MSQGNTVSDSVVGYVFCGREDGGGTFRLRPDSTVIFAWSSGQAVRVAQSVLRRRVPASSPAGAS